MTHMNQAHNVEIIDYKEIWTSIKDFYEGEVEKLEKRKKVNKANNLERVKRGVFLKYWKPLLRTIKQETESKFRKVFEEQKIDKQKKNKLIIAEPRTK